MLLQAFLADDVRQQYVRFRGRVRANELDGSAKLWMRADGPVGPLGFNDGWPNLVTEDSDWQDYEVTLYIPDDTLAIRIGIVLQGSGEFRVDKLEVLVSDDKAFGNPTAL